MTIVAVPPGRALASNSLAVAGSRAFVGALKAVTVVMIARHVPVGDFGQLALALAIVEIFRQLADFGLEIVGTREVARAEASRLGEVLGTTLAMKLALGGIAYGGVLVVAWLVYADMGALPLAAALGLIVLTSSVSTAIGTYFQAQLRMAQFVWTAVIGALVGFGAVMGLVLTGHVGVVALAAALLVGDLVGASLAPIALRRSTSTRLVPSRATAGNMMRDAWPVAVTQALVIVYFRLDVILLARLDSRDAVGLYGVAVKLTEPLLLVPAAMAVSLYGAAAPLWGRGGDAAAVRLYRRLAGLAATYGVLVALGLTLLAPELLARAVPQYVAAVPALSVLAWSLAFMAVNMVTTAALNSLGQFRLTTLIAGITLAVSLAANLILIPRLGIIGASAATVLTEAANCGFQLAALAAILRRRLAMRYHAQ